jgi:hypothetical protein
MKNVGFAVLLVLLVAGCGESRNQSSGSAPATVAPGGAPSGNQAPSPKAAGEQPAERRQLPPSEPYGTTN